MLAGAQRIGNNGYFFPITVLSEVPDDARVMRDEPFGPLAGINPVRSLDGAIEKANALPYALADYAFTNPRTTPIVSLTTWKSATLSINHLVASSAETPFGSVKESGCGREGLQCCTVVKNVSHKKA